MKAPLSIACVTLLAGCAGPSEEKIAADFATRHPGCTLDSTEGGTNSNDLWEVAPQETWIELRYQCNGSSNVDFFWYRKDPEGSWSLQ